MRLLKPLIATVFAIAIGVSAFAQGFEDLEELYQKEKYARLEFKAYNYSVKENTKREPLPYLYMAMANLEIYKSPEYETKHMEIYPRAFKDAMRNAGKFRKKDKKNLHSDAHPEFFVELKEMMIADAEQHYANKKYSKALYNYKQMTVFDKDNQVAWLMKAVCEMQLKRDTEAQRTFQTAMSKPNAMEFFNQLPQSQQDILREGLLSYSTTLIESGLKDSAMSTIDVGIVYFENDEDFQARAEEARGLEETQEQP